MSKNNSNNPDFENEIKKEDDLNLIEENNNDINEDNNSLYFDEHEDNDPSSLQMGSFFDRLRNKVNEFEETYSDEKNEEITPDTIKTDDEELQNEKENLQTDETITTEEVPVLKKEEQNKTKNTFFKKLKNVFVKEDIKTQEKQNPANNEDILIPVDEQTEGINISVSNEEETEEKSIVQEKEDSSPEVYNEINTDTQTIAEEPKLSFFDKFREKIITENNNNEQSVNDQEEITEEYIYEDISNENERVDKEDITPQVEYDEETFEDVLTKDNDNDEEISNNEIHLDKEEELTKSDITTDTDKEDNIQETAKTKFSFFDKIKEKFNPIIEKENTENTKESSETVLNEQEEIIQETINENADETSYSAEEYYYDDSESNELIEPKDIIEENQNNETKTEYEFEEGSEIIEEETQQTDDIVTNTDEEAKVSFFDKLKEKFKTGKEQEETPSVTENNEQEYFFTEESETSKDNIEETSFEFNANEETDNLKLIEKENEYSFTVEEEPVNTQAKSEINKELPKTSLFTNLKDFVSKTKENLKQNTPSIEEIKQAAPVVEIGKNKKQKKYKVGQKRLRVERYKTTPTSELANSSKNTLGKRIARGVFLTIVITVLVGMFVGIGVGIIWMAEAPNLDMSKFNFIASTVILDNEGNEYQTLQGTENRTPVKIDEIPEIVQLAFVAIEDQRYYQHSGVDIIGTSKAIFNVLFTGSLDGPGGSTITQQLIKLTHLTSDKQVKRKVQEWKLAFELEQELSKEEILEAYLNKINLSQAWGVEAGAQFYFGKSCKDISIAQAAVLASIVNAPTYYNPLLYEEDEDGDYNLVTSKDKNGKTIVGYDPNNQGRALNVISKMKELGFITEEEYLIAKDELENNKIGLIKPNSNTKTYSYFTDAVYSQVLEDVMEQYNYTQEDASSYILNSGLIIHSTVDPVIQKTLEKQAANDSNFLSQNSNARAASRAMTKKKGEKVEYIPQLGGAIIENKTGYVVAIIGGREKEGNLTMNRALQKFQVGSTAKPISTYAPGIDSKKLTLADTFPNIRIKWGSWSPQNAGGGASGKPMTVRQGLTGSVNIIAVLSQKKVGDEICGNYAKKFGLELVKDDYNSAALALGGYTYGQSPLAMCSAFSTFPNKGKRVTPTFYTHVTDADGNVVLEAQQETIQVISEQTAWLITSVLKNVVKGGTTYISIPGQQVAGKTGTTDENIYAWFCGYTRDYTGAFWFGYDAQKVTANGTTYKLRLGLYGGNKSKGPSGFFEDVFREFYKKKNLKSANLQSRPGGLVYSGGDWLIKGTSPTRVSAAYKEVDVCSESGLLPNDTCNVETKKFWDESKMKSLLSGGVPVGGKNTIPKKTCPIDHPKAEVPTVTPSNPSGGTTTPTTPSDPSGGGSTTTPTTPTPGGEQPNTPGSEGGSTPSTPAASTGSESPTP